MYNRIREVRHEKGMTIKEVVEKLETELNYEVTEYHYTNVENERIGFSVRLLVAISNLFQVSTDYLLGLSEIKQRE